MAMGANLIIGQPPLLQGLNAVANFKVSNTRKLRHAFAKVRSGAGRGSIGVIGDSNMMGSGTSTGTSGLDGAKRKSAPRRMAEILNQSSLPVVERGFFGSAGVSTAQMAAYDNRLTLGAGWAPTSAGIAGGYMRNSTDTTNFAYAPGVSFDTIEYWYLQAAGKGSFSIDINGGSPIETIASAGVNALVKRTLTVSAGVHVVNFKRVSGEVNICGVTVYTAATKELDIHNLGVSGSTSGTVALTTNPWSPGPAHAALGCDAYLLCIGTNDWGVTAEATYEANVQAKITSLLAVGDVILVNPLPRAVATTSKAVQDAYNARFRKLAGVNDIPYIDTRVLFETQEIADVLDWYYDATHLKDTGAAVWGNLLAACVASM
jgi:lysophospholipase L1-like esterase